MLIFVKTTIGFYNLKESAQQCLLFCLVLFICVILSYFLLLFVIVLLLMFCQSLILKLFGLVAVHKVVIQYTG